jgi:hypothetical protein
LNQRSVSLPDPPETEIINVGVRETPRPCGNRHNRHNLGVRADAKERVLEALALSLIETWELGDIEESKRGGGDLSQQPVTNENERMPVFFFAL